MLLHSRRMDDEQKRAAEAEIAAKILETAGELENLLGDGKASKEMDPRDEAFWSTVMRFEEEHQAKANLLEELIDIVLPQAQLNAVPIRSLGSIEDPQKVGELEALFGTFPEKARSVDWLAGEALLLEGGLSGFLEYVRQAQEGQSGFQEGERLFLLLDGRLVVVRYAGVWRIHEKQVKSNTIIIGASEVQPVDAVQKFSFRFILVALRSCLTVDFEFLKDQYVPDRAERLERFDALVAEFGQAMGEYIDRLRRVGDSPA